MGGAAGSCKGTGTGVVSRLPLVVDRQSVAVVPEDLAPLGRSVAEDEQAARERVVPRERPHDLGQAVEALAHIDRGGGDPALHALARSGSDHAVAPAASRA